MPKILLLLLISTPSFADQTHCLARIMYAEARGEPLEGVIAVGQAASNRGNPCEITGVKRREPTKTLLEYYRALASQILRSKTDIVTGADSWNTGTKPAYKGDVTRQIGKHVFYVLRAEPE